jgi:hypothetical protein
VLGDITPDGSVIAQVIHEFNNTFSAKIQGQSRQGKWAGGQLEVRVLRECVCVCVCVCVCLLTSVRQGFCTGSGWAGSVKLVNIDLFHDSGIVYVPEFCITSKQSTHTHSLTHSHTHTHTRRVCNYMQKVSKSLALGGELMYQYNDGVEQSSLAFAARHKTPTHVAALTLSPIGILQSSYFAAVNQRTAVGTQLEVDLRQADSTFNVGFQYNFREATFRGQVRLP